MPNNAEAITAYSFSSTDELLLDTNVWFMLFGPQKPGDKRVQVYSDAIARILKAQCRIYIDVLIVSEFINTYARAQWKLSFQNFADFKHFRKSAQFKSVARDIAADMKRVLQYCSRTSDEFESLPIDHLLDTYAQGDSDFNDQVLAALCRSKGYKLITDDADFK
jgi:predicted nucleic acid-binding protein